MYKLKNTIIGLIVESTPIRIYKLYIRIRGPSTLWYWASAISKEAESIVACKSEQFAVHKKSQYHEDKSGSIIQAVRQVLWEELIQDGYRCDHAQ